MDSIFAVIFMKLPYLGIAFSVALIIASLTPQLHKILHRRNDSIAVQSAHSNPTLRLGGLACFLAMVFGSFSADISAPILLKFIIAGAPLFIIGLLEDFGIHMSPKKRMGAIALSVVSAIYIFNISITQVGVPGLDVLLSFHVIAVLFTIFAVSGVVNAFNLIDGLNGLASFTAATVALSLSVISIDMGYADLQHVSILVMLTSAGFFAVNYPFGRLFLGDAGAYFLGFVLVCIALLVYHRQPEISAFAILLIFFWPVADTCLAIWRRTMLSTPHDRPDRLHFHQLVMRFLEIRVFGRNTRERSNPVATLILMPLIVAPQIAGVVLIDDHASAILAVFAFAALFVMSYVFGMKHAKIRRVKPKLEDRQVSISSVAAE